MDIDDWTAGGNLEPLVGCMGDPGAGGGASREPAEAAGRARKAKPRKEYTPNVGTANYTFLIVLYQVCGRPLLQVAAQLKLVYVPSRSSSRLKLPMCSTSPAVHYISSSLCSMSAGGPLPNVTLTVLHSVLVSFRHASSRPSITDTFPYGSKSGGNGAG